MTFQKMGVRYKKARSRDNKWGPGKVHLLFWDSLNKEWRLLCRPTYWHGYLDVSDAEHVQCSKCLVKMP